MNTPHYTMPINAETIDTTKYFNGALYTVYFT